jgi:hypothetical protein
MMRGIKKERKMMFKVAATTATNRAHVYILNHNTTKTKMKTKARSRVTQKTKGHKPE